jgi:hypothetical protein
MKEEAMEKKILMRFSRLILEVKSPMYSEKHQFSP